MSVLLVLAGGATGSVPATVWAWNLRCGSSALLIEVRLDGHSIHHVVVPICRATPPAPRPASGSPPVSLVFTPTRAIVWHGYTDREDVAAAHAPLAIELSQNSTDANSLMLGITVSDPATRAVYMKTVHVAAVDKSSATDIARGLTLSSRPYRLGSH